MSDPFRVLVVDDDDDYLGLIERVLRGQGIEVTVTSSSLGVTNLIRRVEPHVVLLDVNIPALSGDALIALARKTAPSHTRFVLYSSCDESQLRSLAQKAGADGYVSKSVDPFKLGEILRSVSGPPSSRRIDPRA